MSENHLRFNCGPKSCPSTVGTIGCQPGPSRHGGCPPLFGGTSSMKVITRAFSSSYIGNQVPPRGWRTSRLAGLWRNPCGEADFLECHIRHFFCLIGPRPAHLLAPPSRCKRQATNFFRSSKIIAAHVASVTIGRRFFR